MVKFVHGLPLYNLAIFVVVILQKITIISLVVQFHIFHYLFKSGRALVQPLGGALSGAMVVHGRHSTKSNGRTPTLLILINLEIGEVLRLYLLYQLDLAFYSI